MPVAARPLRLIRFALLIASLPTAFVLAQQMDDEPSMGFAARSGRMTFKTYCASCHGVDGMGDGPIAKHLKIPPTDVTRITARYGGEFPKAWIYEIIDGRADVRGHGTREMPVWGDIFQSPLVDAGGDPIEQGPNRATRKIHELVVFLTSIQVAARESG